MSVLKLQELFVGVWVVSRICTSRSTMFPSSSQCRVTRAKTGSYARYVSVAGPETVTSYHPEAGTRFFRDPSSSVRFRTVQSVV